MVETTLQRRALALLLLLAAWRTWWASLRSPPVDLLDPVSGAAPILPDLARDDWVRLSWLPGVGEERAKQIVARRPHLGVLLIPERLALVDGFGEITAREVQAWYRKKGWKDGSRVAGAGCARHASSSG